MKDQKRKTVSFRLTPEEYERLEAIATERGYSIGEYVRDLALGAARSQPMEKKLQALDTLIRKATEATIAALSPEMNEDQAEAFLRAYLPGGGRQ
jgi:predicted DNA-binding protein